MQPRFTDKKSEPKRRDGKYISLSLKLGYNALTDINGLYDWCSLNFLKPNEISSIDLSFNCFSNIPMVFEFFLHEIINIFIQNFIQGIIEIFGSQMLIFTWK